MIDDLVGIVGSQPVVAFQLIGEQCGPRLHVVSYQPLELFLSTLGHDLGTNLAAPFKDACDNGLVHRTAPVDFLAALLSVHVPGLAPDERLIGLDFPRQLAALARVLQRKTNPVEHEPRRLLSDPNVAGDLVARHTVLAIGDQPNGSQPLPQGDRRVLEGRSDLDGELLTALAALPDPPCLQEHRIRLVTMRANDAIRPTLCGKIVQRVVGIGEVFNGFEQRLGGVVHA